MEILKGPAAASAYGARAAAGAILITTKAGKAGPTRYTLRSSFGWDNANNYYDLQRQFSQGTFGGPGGIRSWGRDLVASGETTYDHARELSPSA